MNDELAKKDQFADEAELMGDVAEMEGILDVAQGLDDLEAAGEIEAGHPGPCHDVYSTPCYQGPQDAQRSKQKQWQGRGDEADAAKTGGVGCVLYLLHV